ncbi:MAG: galactokinase [Chthoniobacterales bacterium]
MPTPHDDPTRVWAFAPGRVELLGNHTDYNEGLVLGAAIDRGLTVSGKSRQGNTVAIRSATMGHVEVELDGLQPLTEMKWANYALGVVRELIEAGVPVAAFEAEVEGNLPARSGLSSSAAFEVATALFLLRLEHHELPPMTLAKLCQRAEHRFVGVQSGLLDQVISIFGREHHLIFFDTRTEEVRTIPFPADLALIIAGSGKERELSRGDYNLRREQTHAAATALGVRALRDVSSAELAKRSDIDPLLSRRARHIVEENERVRQAIKFLANNDAAAFGKLMNDSHESSRMNFENSTAELDLLVQLAREQAGVLGARLTGAGFGGAIVALCCRGQAEDASGQLHAAYLERTGISSEVFVCRISEGAR